MKRVNPIATACFTAVLCLLTIGAAAQDNVNRRTFLTFNNAVELPGVTLQAGTYLFRLADSQTNRHIVQVFSQDEKQIHATLLAVPAERLETSDENVIMFREEPAGATPAIQYWYYPGVRTGHEFVYPKEQAMRIAQRTGQNVLSTEGEIASSSSEVSSIDRQGQVSQWPREGQAPMPEQTQVQGSAGVSDLEPTPDQQSTQAARDAAEAAAEPEPAADAIDRPAAVATSGQAEPSTAIARNDASELPRTASPLPLSGLIGLLSLGTALGLRRSRR
jgi:hypothetical protein